MFFFMGFVTIVPRKKGILKAIKRNISQRIFVFLGFILTSKGTQKSTIRKQKINNKIRELILIFSGIKLRVILTNIM